MCTVTNRPPGESHTGTAVLQRGRTGRDVVVLQRNRAKAAQYTEWKKSARKENPHLNEAIIVWRTPAHNLNNAFQVLI